MRRRAGRIAQQRAERGDARHAAEIAHRRQHAAGHARTARGRPCSSTRPAPGATSCRRRRQSAACPGMTSNGTRTDSRSANHHRPASATSEPISVCARAPIRSASRPPAIEATHHRHRQRQQRLTHRPRPEVTDLIEEDRQLEEQRVHRHVLQRDDRAAADERAAREQREIDNRRRGAPLPDRKHDQQHGADWRRATTRRSRPSAARRSTSVRPAASRALPSQSRGRPAGRRRACTCGATSAPAATKRR